MTAEVFTQEVISTPFTTWTFDASQVVKVEGKPFQDFSLHQEVIDALDERGISASVTEVNVLKREMVDGFLTSVKDGTELQLCIGQKGIEHYHDEPVYAYEGQKILFLNYGEFSVIDVRHG